MKDSTIKSKVKVFISSRCKDKCSSCEDRNSNCTYPNSGSRNKYAVARKALGTLLEETNIVDAYIFEDSAGSRPPEDIYLSKLDDSDLCIFLIDNADGVSKGVLRERKRARDRNKKSLYFFCNETQKEPTPLQNEIRSESRETYKEVPLFSDIVDQAYRAVMEEIVDIYREYCAGRLVPPSTNEIQSGTPSQLVSSYTLDRRLVSGFEKTKSELQKLVQPTEHEVPASSPLDEHASRLLRVLTGQEKSSTLDFKDLRNNLAMVYRESPIRDLVLLRVEAVSAYLSGHLHKCLRLLNEAYKQSESEASIPTWLKNDILIDSRYIEFLIGETKNRLFFKTDSQSRLDQSPESVYYPLVDRYDSSLYKGILNKHHTKLLSSPYSTNFMSYSLDLENLAGTFIIALLHGSLVHLLQVRQRLTDVITAFSLVYQSGPKMYVELIRLLLLEQDDRGIARIMDTLDRASGLLSATDVDRMLSSVETISIPHRRLISKCLLLKHFGSYMSDSSFDILSREIVDEIDKWISNRRRLLVLGNCLFDALRAVVYRAESEEAIRVSFRVLQQGLKRWFDEALGVITGVDPARIPTDIGKKLTEWLINAIGDNSIREHLHDIQRVLIFARRLAEDCPKALDHAVEKHLPDFFTGDYSLAAIPKVHTLAHIPRFLEEAHRRNKEQGKNGLYYEYMDEPLDIVRFIVQGSDACPDDQTMEAIVRAIEDTLFAPNQTYRAKISAIRLAMALLNKNQYASRLGGYIDTWLEKREAILRGHKADIINKDTEKELDFTLVLLRVCAGKHDVNELLSHLASAVERGEYQVISALESIAVLFQNCDVTSMDQASLSLLCQYVIATSHHESVYVRRQAARVLVMLVNSPFQSVSVARLSTMMDDDSFRVKTVILRGLNDTGLTEESEMIRYIRQKGAADNHFMVRKLAVTKVQ